LIDPQAYRFAFIVGGVNLQSINEHKLISVA
jgi:hypothetical protein